MSESVNLPALGESVTEGTVTRWLKNVGDSVEVDEPLLEVSTDKVDTEIPSPVAGVIEEILVAEDETVEVGTALVRIGDGSGAGDAPASADSASADSASADSASATSGSGDSLPAQSAPESSSEPAAEAPAVEESPAGQPAAEARPVAPPAPEVAPEPQPAAPAAAAPAPPASPEPASAPSESSTNAPEAAASGNDAAPIEEVPSNDAPAPGESGAAAPAPASAIDRPPAAAPAPDVTPAPAAPTPVASSVPAPPVPAADDVPAQDPQASAGGSNAGYVTPLVRKLANEKGVDLAPIAGTGVGGRIRKEDVLAAEAAKSASAAPSTERTQPARTPLETSPLRGTTVPMSRLRKVIAERAVQSMQSSAQLTSVVEVDVTKVAAFRARVKDDFQQKAGVKLSFLPFFALAAAEALKAFPIINATVDTESNSIVYPPHENLSIAVDTERGLLTPVVRDAADLDLLQLAQQIADLAERTRDNKLKPDELAGGTFTLTNTGSRGALFDTPLVFLPQSAILGTGIVTKKPVVISQDGSDAIAIRSTVYLALSYDHRIVDGADAARFLVAVKERLEAGDFAGSLGV